MFENLLKDIDVKLNTDYFLNKAYFDSISKKIVFTGKIDQYYDYIFGRLEYRTLDFVHEEYDNLDFQGCSVVNYTEREIPWTRIVEHKHFVPNKPKNTLITKEYSRICNDCDIPFYPININDNNRIYEKYKEISNDKVVFGGRLGSYRYINMDETIEMALALSCNEKKLSSH
jgi:UDP-galactopyranose mutase